MSIFLIAFLASLAMALVVLGVSGAAVFRRVLLLHRRSKRLQRHPTLIALRAARTVGGKLDGLQPRLEEIGARWERIAASTAELMGTSALLRLQVDRIGFATRLLLDTFVPTLRGSMAD